MLLKITHLSNFHHHNIRSDLAHHHKDRIQQTQQMQTAETAEHRQSYYRSLFILHRVHPPHTAATALLPHFTNTSPISILMDHQAHWWAIDNPTVRQHFLIPRATTFPTQRQAKGFPIPTYSFRLFDQYTSICSNIARETIARTQPTGQSLPLQHHSPSDATLDLGTQEDKRKFLDKWRIGGTAHFRL